MSKLDAPTRRALGRMLRELRQREGLTLVALSRDVGVSPSALSQFETGRAEPTLGTLWALGRALNASLFDFFAARQSSHVDVTRADERTIVSYELFRYEAVVRSSRRKLDLFYLYLLPDVGLVRDPISHAGEEAGVVVSGSMEVLVDGATHCLEVGDGIWFASDRPHSFRAVGGMECVSVWADTLPDHAPDRAEIDSLFGSQHDEARADAQHDDAHVRAVTSGADQAASYLESIR